MIQRGYSGRRSRAEWWMRAVLAVLAGCAGFYAITHSLAVALSVSDPHRGHQLAPFDARLAAAWSERLSGPEATQADRTRADKLARDALRRDPTAVAAVSTLGVNALLRGDEPSARRLFTYSQELSRRDLRTQLWAIEDAVARGDIPSALEHYDIALRTQPKAPDLLFPVLASAVADPAIRSHLVRALAGRPVWSEGFLNHIAGQGASPQSTVALYQALRQARVSVPESASATVISKLIAADRFEEAWSYYASLHRHADRSRGRDLQFTADLAYPTAFDWVPASDPGLSASIQSDAQGGTFDFSVPPSMGGTLLRQLQMLPPGRYALTGRSQGIEQPRGSLPYWSLKCVRGVELARIDIPNSSQFGGQFSGHFVVPDDCPAQALALVARQSHAMGGLTGQIAQLSLRPLQ